MDRNLTGQRVLITRPGSDKDSRLVESFGAEAIPLPMLDLVYCGQEQEKEIQSSLGSIGWIVLTSAHAARFFLDYLGRINRMDWLKDQHIAVIGEKTRQLIESRGFTVSFMPSRFEAAVFVQEFPYHTVTGTVLFPVGKLAKNTIIDAFRERSLVCYVWTLYDTKKVAYSPDQFEKTVMCATILTFASPSAVRFFYETAYGTDVMDKLNQNRWTIAVIGPSTGREAARLGLTVHVQPSVYTMEAMLEEAARYVAEMEEEY